MKKPFRPLMNCYGDQHLVAVYRSQLKMRTQGVGQSFQEFATVAEELLHCSYPVLLKDHVRRQTRCLLTLETRQNAYTEREREGKIEMQ